MGTYRLYITLHTGLTKTDKLILYFYQRKKTTDRKDYKIRGSFSDFREQFGLHFRFWKKVFVRLVYQGDNPVLQLFNTKEDKDPFQELPLQACYSVSDIGKYKNHTARSI
jgi:hypothetical protein